jgi:hypothetical protein
LKRPLLNVLYFTLFGWYFRVWLTGTRLLSAQAALSVTTCCSIKTLVTNFFIFCHRVLWPSTPAALTYKRFYSVFRGISYTFNTRKRGWPTWPDLAGEEVHHIFFRWWENCYVDRDQLHPSDSSNRHTTFRLLTSHITI